MFQPNTQEKGSPKLLLTAIIVGGVLFIGALVAAIYFFNEYKTLKKDSGVAAQAEQDRILKKVKTLYNTPDESPSIIQVKDQSKLSDQKFFKDARNGDYVLVYQEARMAILYRESSNKIINTGPIVLDQDDTEGASGADGGSSGSGATDGSSTSSGARQ